MVHGHIKRRRFLSSALTSGIALRATLSGLATLGTNTARGALPLREAGSISNRVVVIGAGLAGLAAAHELSRAGHQVVVLEARKRPGGRVFTDRATFTVPVERGAVAYSSAFVVANRYIDELGLGRLPFPAPDLPRIYQVNDQRRAVAPGDSLQGLYALTDQEAALGPRGLVREYFVDNLPPEALRTEAWPSEALAVLEKQSFAEFLKLQGASDGAIKLLEDAVYFGWDPENASALSIAMTEIGLFSRGRMFLLDGGSSRLPEALASQLGDAVTYGAEVTELRAQSKGVAVRYLGQEGDHTVLADHVVLAVPAPVAKSRAEAFRLSTRYRSALQALAQHEITRVQFEVDGAYWREQGHAGSAVTDLFGGRVDQQPYHEVGDPSRPAVLDALVVGPEAGELAALSDDVLFDQIAIELERIHPGFTSHREDSAVTRWVDDSLTLGGWSWPEPGFLSAHYAALKQPQGRMHFAGEHTSLLRATLEGALESGVRAAAEIDSLVEQRMTG